MCVIIYPSAAETFGLPSKSNTLSNLSVTLSRAFGNTGLEIGDVLPLDDRVR